MRGDMKSLRFIALLGVAASLTATSHVLAQPVEQTAPAKTEAAPKKIRFVKIKNVPSALIAYQLDPAHNPAPTGTTPQKGAFDLPGDIERIISIDPQNVILITGGSEEDLRRLQELIDVLDQPLRQVELEAQYVEIETTAIAGSGIDFFAGFNNLQVGFVRGNFTKLLNRLIAQNKAKIVAAPPASAFNNLTDNASDPAFLAQNLADWFHNVTATHNGETITLSSKVTTKANGKTAFTFVANLRDGDTVVLQPSADKQPAETATAGRTTLLFVTARIIRQSGKPTATP